MEYDIKKFYNRTTEEGKVMKKIYAILYPKGLKPELITITKFPLIADMTLSRGYSKKKNALAHLKRSLLRESK